MALERLFQIRHVFALWGALGILLLASAPAAAQSGEGWSVCNETSRIVELATGRPLASTHVIEGWTRIRPGECRTVVEAPLRSGEIYYLYGRTSRAHRGGMRSWVGDYPFCVDSQGAFSLESLPNCTAMGLETRKFQPVLIESSTSWSTTLKETQKWTRERAQSAGIQRLLDDAGVESGSIDGYIGRRTRGAIRDFLSAQKLSTETTDAELLIISSKSPSIDHAISVSASAIARMSVSGRRSDDDAVRDGKAGAGGALRPGVVSASLIRR